MGVMDTKGYAKPRNYGTSAKAPAKATSSDDKGERREKMRGGVAMGKEDGVGADKQFNTGRTEGTCYTHTRSEYR
jgi:hypothetical protein